MPWVTRRQEWVTTPRKEVEPTHIGGWLFHKVTAPRSPFAFQSDLSPQRRDASPFLISRRSIGSGDDEQLTAEDSFKSLSAPFSKLSLVTKRLLSAQPRMEVATGPGGLNVYADCDPSSPVLAELQPFQLLRVLVTRTLDDGRVRACIVLEGSSTPLGWVTSRAADGTPLIYLYSRPLYEVITPPKVRAGFDSTSRFVKQLGVGAKLHVVEARRAPDGALRVFVVPVGQTEPLGWLTAKKPDGTRTIREMDVGEATQRNAFARPGSIGALSQSARALRRSREDGSASARDSPISRSATRASKEGLGLSRAERRSRELSSTSSHTILQQTMESHPLGRRSARTVREAKETSPGERRPQTGLRSAPSASSAAAVAAARRAAKSRAASPSAKNSNEDASAFKQGEGSFKSSVAESNSAAKRAQKNAIAIRAAEQAAEDFLKSRAADGGNYVSSTDLLATVKALLKKATQEEAASSQEGKKIAARLGNALAETKLSVKDVLREWDPNGDGSISKMEFRVDVRKMLGNDVDVREVDSLFEELDSDKSGAIDINELKVALTQLKEAASGAIRSEQLKVAAAKEHRERAAQAQEVAEATALVEQTADEISTLRDSRSISAQFFRAMQKKNLKAGSSADMLNKIESSQAEINLKEFKRLVTSMGVESTQQELSELFTSLDADGGGTLDKEEMNAWLTQTLEEAEETKQQVQRLALTLVGALKTMKSLQAGWKKLIRADEEAAAKEAERLAQEEEERAAAEAEQERKRIALLEKKAAAAEAERAAFEARIASKRAESFGAVPPL